MLAVRKTNINFKELPYELNKLIEDYTEITFTIVIEELRQYIKKVKLVNVFNNEVLEEIFLDDTNFNIIKLSSDGSKLIYLDYSNNMVYYNINTKTKEKIFVMALTPLNYYFDRNGLYFINSGSQTTYVFDIMNRKLMYELPFNTYLYHEIEMISPDYKKLLVRNNNCVFVYDLLTGKELYYNNTEVNHLGLVGSDKNFNHIIMTHGPQYTIAITDINNNHIFEYDEDDINNITSLIFDKDLLIIHFYNYIKIINVKDNKTKQIEAEESTCDCIMELIDGKYLIIKKNEFIVETILI